VKKNFWGNYEVFTHSGSKNSKKNPKEWCKQLEEFGAGEILFTSMNNDGTKNGFANEALAKLSEIVNIPIIASGGAGTMEHFAETFINGKADAALAASVFHYQEIEIPILKQFLKEKEISIRL
jgi:cyclase